MGIGKSSLENLVSMNENFWKGKKVFVTGHTGFKGTWLCHWLNHLGAKVHGYALAPQTAPSLFELTHAKDIVTETIADITDAKVLTHAMQAFAPDIVFHMAAQALVRDSYADPVKTYSTNIMGTVVILEALRGCKTVKAFINVTTDKCYQNREWLWGYRENEALGGYDPYSSSKACSEIVTSAYRDSFFNPHSPDPIAGIASARAGNVIGGGDFAKDRLIPDCVRSVLSGNQIVIRYPGAIRPWQHVLEPLAGYLLLAEKLFEDPRKYAGAYNFGPDDADAKPVEWIVKKFCEKWQGATYAADHSQQPHEAHFLKLDITKARSELGFRPRWNIERAIDSIISWTRAFEAKHDVGKICVTQIEEYVRS